MCHFFNNSISFGKIIFNKANNIQRNIQNKNLINEKKINIENTK